MSKRLLFLEKTTREDSVDPFVWYGLALEYRSANRHDEALQTFATLRTKFTGYVPTYLMCAQLLIELGRKASWNTVFSAGWARASWNIGPPVFGFASQRGQQLLVTWTRSRCPARNKLLEAQRSTSISSTLFGVSGSGRWREVRWRYFQAARK